MLHRELPLEQQDASKRLYSVSFQGSIGTHKVRQTLQDMYASHSLFAFLSKDKGNWKDIIRLSNFTLCPRGNGPTSFRMFEVGDAGPC